MHEKMKEELPDPELTHEEKAKVNLLSEKQIEDIDKALISEVSHQYQKVAKIVGMTMLKLPSRVSGIPDLFYSQRIKKLVDNGFLESQGNLQFMRYSEVRIINNL